MFLLAGGIQFGPPCLEWYNENTMKYSLDLQKKSEKVKILSQLFFQLPIWRQKRIIDNKAAIFPPQIRHFLAQSRKLFHKVNIMFWSKCLTGHMKFNFDNFVENFFDKGGKIFAQTRYQIEKKAFWKKIHQKVLGRLKCNFDKTDETFFFRTKIFCRSQTKSNETWQNFAKIEKFFGHVECSLGNAAETFHQRSGGLSLKVWKQFWKIRKKTLSMCSCEQVNCSFDNMPKRLQWEF